MQIDTLFAQLDQKLIELDQRLDNAAVQLAQCENESERGRLRADIQALNLVKDKLLKSRDIAGRAHRLQHQDHELKMVQRKRWLGLALCALSAIGAVAIAIIFWLTELR